MPYAPKQASRSTASMPLPSQDLRQQHLSQRDCSGNTVDICVAIQSVVTAAHETVNSKVIRVELDLPGEAWVATEPALMHLMLRRLLRDAIAATPAKSVVSISLLRRANCWELEIADGRISEDPMSHAADAADASMTSGTMHPVASAKTDVLQSMADVMGCKLTQFNCPQGGTAHVLMLPSVAKGLLQSSRLTGCVRSADGQAYDQVD